jgi:ankyrin repeat protein
MNRKTKLLEAIRTEKTGLIIKLLKPGLFGLSEAVNVDSVYGFSDIFTPLIYAVEKGKLISAGQLIKSGANVNLRGNFGNTPLIVAVKYCDYNMVKLLIDNGADPNIKNVHSDSALTICAKRQFDGNDRGVNENIAAILLRSGAEVNVKNEYAETPLLNALTNGNLKIGEMLINSGADIYQVNPEGLSLMQLAISYAYREGIDFEFVKLLARNGVDINAQYKNGDLPVKQALRMGHKLVYDWLIENGAMIDPAEKAQIEAKRKHLMDVIELGYFCKKCGYYKDLDETEEDSYDQDEWVTIYFLRCKKCGGMITNDKGSRIITRVDN